MFRDAVFSRNKKYRYKLIRTWDKQLAKIAFVMLNPSTADHKKDDPTITRCISFASDWGYGGVDIFNLFAFRSPYPEVLFAQKDPVGPRNRMHLKQALVEYEQVICAWGNDGKRLNQEARFFELVNGLEVYCLKKNKTGSPAHPLYIPKTAKVFKYINR